MNEFDLTDQTTEAPAGVLPLARGATWQKSKRSNSQGNCVEVAELTTGQIAVRNSRNPDGTALVFTPAEFAAFVNGAKDGEFDPA